MIHIYYHQIRPIHHHSISSPKRRFIMINSRNIGGKLYFIVIITVILLICLQVWRKIRQNPYVWAFALSKSTLSTFYRRWDYSIKISVLPQKSTVIMIRNRIVKAVLVFYREALIYKAFLYFESGISVRIKSINILPTEFLRIYTSKTCKR